MTTETMIESGLTEARWQLNRRETKRAGSGHGATIVKGEPYWTVEMKWKFPREERAAFMTQSAQAQRLEGGVNLIQLWRPQRRNALAFDASGGDGTVSALSVNTSTRVADLTCGGELGLGDMVSWTVDADGNRYLGEIVEVQSRPAAGQLLFKAQPRVVAAHSTPAAAIYKAYGLFTLEALSINEPIGMGDPATIEASFKQVTI